MRDDVLSGFVTFERAREVYGVAFVRGGGGRLAGGRRAEETAAAARGEDDGSARVPARRQGRDRHGRELGHRRSRSPRRWRTPGARLVLCGRDEERLAACGERVRRAPAGRRRHHVRTMRPRRIVGAAVDAFGGIDVLVHSAGIFEPMPFTETTAESFDRQWHTNVRAPFLLTQRAARAPRARRVGGLHLVDRRPRRLPELGRLLRLEGRGRADDKSARDGALAAAASGSTRSRRGTSRRR